MRTKLVSGLSILSFCFLYTSLSPCATAQTTSTPEERASWAAVSHKLESNPLDDAINKEGESATDRLAQVHDIHIALCQSLFTQFSGMTYKYRHQVVRQYMLASGAFAIENPDKASDGFATAQAAVESVLKFYSAILQQKPDAKVKLLDDLLKQQSKGKLADAVHKQCSST
jgi:hypothetical protein